MMLYVGQYVLFEQQNNLAMQLPHQPTNQNKRCSNIFHTFAITLSGSSPRERLGTIIWRPVPSLATTPPFSSGLAAPTAALPPPPSRFLQLEPPLPSLQAPWSLLRPTQDRLRFFRRENASFVDFSGDSFGHFSGDSVGGLLVTDSDSFGGVLESRLRKVFCGRVCPSLWVDRDCKEGQKKSHGK